MPLCTVAQTVYPAFNNEPHVVMTRVHHRGPCAEKQLFAGGCWAFAAAAALEAAVAVATQLAQPPHLAEQESVDCLLSGCTGGRPGDALMRALTTTYGLASEDAYPYTSGDTAQAGTCKVSAA